MAGEGLAFLFNRLVKEDEAPEIPVLGDLGERAVQALSGGNPNAMERLDVAQQLRAEGGDIVSSTLGPPRAFAKLDPGPAAKVPDFRQVLARAERNGNTIYEELQGDSVIASAVADWNDVVTDIAGSAKAGLAKAGRAVNFAAEWVSPTWDATPGKRTIEDTIDEIIFDPNSALAPLEIMALGATSTSKAAVSGVKFLAKKIGWNVDDFVKAKRAIKLTGREPVAAPAAKVVEGFAHDVGGASAEAIARKAGGTRFFRVNPAGRVTPVLTNAEDAALRAGRDVVVRVTPSGEKVVEGGRVVGQRVQDAIQTLKPGKARSFGPTKTVTLDLGKKAADEDAFLKSLGVQPGRGPKPR